MVATFSLSQSGQGSFGEQEQPGLAATGAHVSYGITQCYLPPGKGDVPVLTPAEAGTRFTDSV